MSRMTENEFMTEKSSIVNRFLLFFFVFKCFATFLAICSNNPAGIYLFKGSNGNTRALCEICSNLAIKTPKRRQ